MRNGEVFSNLVGLHLCTLFLSSGSRSTSEEYMSTNLSSEKGRLHYIVIESVSCRVAHGGIRLIFPEQRTKTTRPSPQQDPVPDFHRARSRHPLPHYLFPSILLSFHYWRPRNLHSFFGDFYCTLDFCFS
ncbi:hypothetical protein BDR07DRAFT_1396680 [Suillus spraguei]|nr:hypothetical protein BDR07DRAFT_1396680 [Suillus spraguei]